MRYVIGMDIGGTHTDGVVIDAQENILACAKCSTTEDLQSGVREILRLLKKTVLPVQVSAIFLGTTHGTNALLQRKGLQRVGLLRLAGQQPELLPPTISWPSDLRSAVGVISETVEGGYECDGRPLTPFSLSGVQLAIERLLTRGVESLAVVGVFSPLCSNQENEVRQLVHRVFGTQIPVSLSHEIGGIGFMERENATLLNATLRKTMVEGFKNMEEACQQEGYDAPLYVTQNDGSLLSLSEGIQYPVLTLAAGPTNSLIGGCRLAGYQDAVVIDVGGTSTDVGALQNGFPLRSMKPSNIGGVRVNFSAPDLLSIALGGGSHVCAKSSKIGPLSVGRQLQQKALCFGGSHVTFTDLAIGLGHLSIPGVSIDCLKNHPNMLSQKQCQMLYSQAEQHIELLVNQMRGRHQNLPCVFVGGGSRLFASTFSLRGTGECTQNLAAHFDVANAYGAALAEIAGTVDTIVSLSERESTLNGLHEEARRRAIAKGADPGRLHLVDQQVIPYPYASNQMARVIMRWSGKPNVMQSSFFH